MEGVADSGRDALFASVGVSLPIWRSAYGAAEQAARSNYRAAEYEQTDLGNRLSAALDDALYRYDDARRKAALYEDALLPKARQSIAAVRSAYETGNADFLDVVDAERILLEFELTARRAAADRLIQLAEIDRLAGGGVFRADSRNVTDGED